MTDTTGEQDFREQDLAARLSLIETMIAEGRQTTESWGWTFVLWGVAYAAAIVAGNLGAPLAEWTSWGHRTAAWPVAMAGAGLIMFLVLSFWGQKSETQPETTVGRSILSIWIAMGASMVVVLVAGGVGGKMQPQMSVAVVGGMLGIDRKSVV